MIKILSKPGFVFFNDILMLDFLELRASKISIVCSVVLTPWFGKCNTTNNKSEPCFVMVSPFY